MKPMRIKFKGTILLSGRARYFAGEGTFSFPAVCVAHDEAGYWSADKKKIARTDL